MARGARRNLFDADIVEQLRAIRRRSGLGYRYPSGARPAPSPGFKQARTDVWYLLTLVDRMQFVEQLKKEIQDGDEESRQGDEEEGPRDG